ncbi:Rhythmically expressed gene 2 protein [Eumeta japonica]|uniref:Rhythmically expressed gene 2 protein n=1 Tax=Eumeta variegata TaxID=151549 RepID=A0A4C2ACC4_EUMVA|nr:Rhythmically expressed gene 2 protein [Eumeta japonica]
MSFPNVRLVTFDVTNTLLKFRIAPWEQYGIAAREFGYHGSNEELAQCLQMSYRDAWMQHPNFGQSSIGWREWWRRVVHSTFKDRLPPTADMDMLTTRLINQYKSESSWCLKHGADRLLTLLRARWLKLGVISNFDPRLFEILHNVNLANKFDFIVTSYESGYYKPDSRIFEYALERCPEILATQALHIGDDIKKDYEAAKLAGWHAVLINDDSTKAQYVFPSLNHLSDAIEENDFLC